MDWKTCAIDDLRQYNQIKIGIINSKEKLNIIKKKVRHANTTSAQRGKKMETNILNALVEGERLQQNIISAESLTKLVDRGLSTLDGEERRILERFYMTSAPKSGSALAAELGYEIRSLYRLRERALQKFTLAMYSKEIS